VFLEYTRAMDTNEDWAEKKEQEKNDRYTHTRASSTKSVNEKRAAEKPHKSTSQREYEAPYTQISF